MEGKIKRYHKLVAGEHATFADWVKQELAITFFSGLKGALGYFIRLKLYPLIFRKMEQGVVVGSDVTLRCPQQIKLGKSVIVDDFVQLIGNSSKEVSIEVGRHSFLRSFAMVNSGPPDGFVRIGRNSSVGQSSIIYGHGGVIIGDNVMIAGQCFIVASSHRFDLDDVVMKEQGFTADGIEIANNVWIGAGSKILDGVKIGDGAIIASNAVVNRDVPPGTIYGGVPARKIGVSSEKDAFNH